MFGNNYGAGFCIACGEEQDGCENCGAREVFGAEQLLIMSDLEIVD